MKAQTELAAESTRVDAVLRAEIDEELSFHIDETVTELVANGWTEEAARTEALRRFGDVGAIASACLRERNAANIMLQRIHTGLIALLVAAVAAMALLSDARANAQRTQLDQMQATIEALAVGNAELVKRVALPASTGAPSAPDEALLPGGVRPESDLERAFAETLANRPGAMARLQSYGDEAVPYGVQILEGEAQIAGLAPGVSQFCGANLLGDTGSPAAVEPLLEALSDPYFNVRRCSALALGKLGDPRAIEALERVAAEDPYVYPGRNGSGPQPLVRLAAQEALEFLQSSLSR